MVSPIIDFITEAINRLRTKSPKFFFVFQLIGAILILLGYVPWMLNRWTPLTPSAYFINFCTDVSKYASGFLLAALFAVKTPVVAQTEEGDAVKVTDDKKMPFTAKAETKVIESTVPPPPIAHDVDKPKT